MKLSMSLGVGARSSQAIWWGNPSARAKFELDGLPAARSAVERLDRRSVLGVIRRGSVSSRYEQLRSP